MTVVVHSAYKLIVVEDEACAFAAGNFLGRRGLISVGKNYISSALEAG